MNDNKNEKRRQKLLSLLLLVMFLVFIVFRQTYQHGRKLLANAHPWDWIALVVIFGVLFYILYKYHREGNEKR